MPSRTFSSSLRLTVGGMNLELAYVPSETSDEISAFLYDNGNLAPSESEPEDEWSGSGLLLSAEVIQGPSFPNLYSLRGTSFRNPATWYRSVDFLRKYDTWCMLPSHGIPVCGQSNINVLLTNFRDAIQYTHDQAIRYMRMVTSLIHLLDYHITDTGVDYDSTITIDWFLGLY